MKQVKKIFSEGENKAYLGLQELEFSADNFIYRRSGVESKAQWSTINNIKESATHFFMYVGNMSAYIIPKGRIRGDKEEFIKFINAKSKSLHQTNNSPFAL